MYDDAAPAIRNSPGAAESEPSTGVRPAPPRGGPVVEVLGHGARGDGRLTIKGNTIIGEAIS